MAPRSSVVIPHGPFTPIGGTEGLDAVSESDAPRRLLFFGSVQEYKGVEDLLVAFAVLPTDLNARLTIAGECDGTLRPVLAELAERSPQRVELRLERVPDDELTRLLAQAHVVVLPYRRSTTSGSAMLALCHGRPVVVPDLPGLSDLPEEAVFRYDCTVQGLAHALTEAVLADHSRLARMSKAADAYSASTSWSDIAEQTLAVMRQVIGPVKNAISEGL
jgi:glycosyltransferase involved in cell wall biosynthesis